MSPQYGELGSLAAEIVSLVWGTPGNFNGFRILAALLHGTLVVSVSQTAALNRGRHLYSAGRPSRWALAHILVIPGLHEFFEFPSMLRHCWLSEGTGVWPPAVVLKGLFRWTWLSFK